MSKFLELIIVVGMIALLCLLASPQTADTLHYLAEGESINVAIAHAWR